MGMDVNQERVAGYFAELRRIGADSNGGITRIAYSEADQKCHDFLKQTAEKLGFTIRYDEIGNLIILLPSSNPHAQNIVIGSHLDSVPNGGNFDGTVGVIAGLEIATMILESKLSLNSNLMIVSFRAEESTRFNHAMIGSGAVTGIITLDELNTLKDKDGQTAFDVIKSAGFKPQEIDLAKWNPNEILVYLEPHADQTPLLHESGNQIGVITGIAAPVRLQITIQGQAAHSGATPMNKRHDALVSAANIIHHIYESLQRACESGSEIVATITKLEIDNPSINKIPGLVKLTLDLRSMDLAERDHMEKSLLIICQLMSEKYGNICYIDETERKIPVSLTITCVLDIIAIQCQDLGLSYKYMPSAAGHDAMNFPNFGMPIGVPTGMFFIPNSGESHSPSEHVEMDGITNSIKLLHETVSHIDKFGISMTR